MNTTSMTATEAITAALAAHPEASAAELAKAAGIGGSTASKCLASLERDGMAVRQSGRPRGRTACRRPLGTRRQGCLDRARGRGGAPAADEDAARPDCTKASCPRSCSTTSKPMAKEAIGPSTLGKALGRSSGAVANACQRLESSGGLRLVSASPRRYQIAEA